MDPNRHKLDTGALDTSGNRKHSSLMTSSIRRGGGGGDDDDGTLDLTTKTQKPQQQKVLEDLLRIWAPERQLDGTRSHNFLLWI